jgi:hypothetical protein
LVLSFWHSFLLSKFSLSCLPFWLSSSFPFGAPLQGFCHKFHLQSVLLHKIVALIVVCLLVSIFLFPLENICKIAF